MRKSISKNKPVLKLHLVTLTGGGDTFRKLVTATTYQWITSDYVNETDIVPDAVQAEMVQLGDDIEETIDVGMLSFDNDRALHAPGKYFDSTSGVLAYLKKNNFGLANAEYHGYIY